MDLNSALQHVLSVDFDVDLQVASLEQAAEALDETFDPADVFTQLSAAYAAVPGFEVADRMVLANFSYAKLPMAKDLETSRERLAGIDLVAAIAGDKEAKDTLREGLLAAQDDLTGETAPEDEFVVLDADASQSAAINAVVRGANTVIQGPPGTGKSQTIANLIATLVAHGSKVLFVAEKRAAIDAVLRRLDAVGLGNLVFDLHDGTANRKRIAQGLGDALGEHRVLRCQTWWHSSVFCRTAGKPSTGTSRRCTGLASRGTSPSMTRVARCSAHPLSYGCLDAFAVTRSAPSAPNS